MQRSGISSVPLQSNIRCYQSVESLPTGKHLGSSTVLPSSELSDCNKGLDLPSVTFSDSSYRAPGDSPWNPSAGIRNRIAPTVTAASAMLKTEEFPCNTQLQENETRDLPGNRTQANKSKRDNQNVIDLTEDGAIQCIISEMQENLQQPASIMTTATNVLDLKIALPQAKKQPKTLVPESLMHPSAKMPPVPELAPEAENLSSTRKPELKRNQMQNPTDVVGGGQQPAAINETDTNPLDIKVTVPKVIQQQPNQNLLAKKVTIQVLMLCKIST
nr:PREDICTED: activating transcription factor 7-interacting protein 2 isoform X2 [Latimeria chalumnae]|eukprot:XP_014350907.1 PREDICTED: activating transcription factor 7-interacting protein 2 isoform X2 [Latimeria chalumnae]